MKNRLKLQKGMTLIELMTTVVIIGIVAAMAVPRFEGTFEKINYKKANRDIISTIKLARSKAISDKAPYGVYIDQSHLTITLFKDVVNPENYEFEDGDEVVRTDTLASDLEFMDTNLDTDAIIFMPNGSARFITAMTTGADIYTLKYSELLVGTQTHNILASTGRIKTVANYY
ncbi:MAG: GspH/FimT family pseudopilin [bacterium]